MIIGSIIAIGLALWLGRRLGPALIAVLLVLAIPIWLVLGLVLTVGRRARRALELRPPD